MAGAGSLTYQVQESFKTLFEHGRPASRRGAEASAAPPSKRAAKLARQAQILEERGQKVPLSRIVVDDIFSIRTMETYTNLMNGFAAWCKAEYRIRYLTEIRMAVMATRYVRERFLEPRKSPWTIRTLLSALNKFAVAVRRKYGCDIGRVDRAALGVLPARKVDAPNKQTSEYPPEDAWAIIDWIRTRRGKRAQLAALVLEVQWRCGLRISEATGLRVRMVNLRAAALHIVETNITKGGRDREVDLPVPGGLTRQLEPLVVAAAGRGPEARVFRLTPHYVRWRVRQACRALGAQKRGTHGYRYRYANDSMAAKVRAGMAKTAALKDTSEEMGHSRPSATYTYVRY